MKDKNGTLQVRGIGELRVAPDEAIVHLRIMTEAKTASAAVGDNAKLTQAVVDAVAAMPNHGITTSGLGVSPIIDHDAKPGPMIVGYRATNGVEIKTKIAYAGQIFDAGIQAGANLGSGITFRLQNEVPYREDALRLATKDAHRQASIVAKAADVDLAGPESIQISPGSSPILFRSSALEAMAPPTPVIPEDVTISAEVLITYRTRST